MLKVTSDPAFYAYVRPLRRQRHARGSEVAVRFDGLPGELLQIDWGEVRQFPFTRSDLQGQTRYFFAARLKYSRWLFVQFTQNMRQETLLRCLIDCFLELGGVPWVVTTDNMKTVTVGRDEHHQAIWHPTFQKFAVEFGFHPDACSLRAGNQKGSVENLVKFVKRNFLGGRSFYDDADLDAECGSWRQIGNEQRVSDATEQVPTTLLPDEQRRFGPLPAHAHDYGLFEIVQVTRESMVHLATNRYSVPPPLIGQALTMRIHPQHIDLYQDDTRVASHRRSVARNARIVEPSHFEAVFARKPRARVMVYRDWLVGLAPIVATYVSDLCRKRYAEMDRQMIQLYDLAQQVGAPEFIAAVALATEQTLLGAEYVQGIVAHPPLRRPPTPEAPDVLTQLGNLPSPPDGERDLFWYEQYVANASTGSSAMGGEA
jgi:transposase